MFKTSLFSSSDTNFPALGIDKPQNIKMDQTDISEGLQHMARLFVKAFLLSEENEGKKPVRT